MTTQPDLSRRAVLARAVPLVFANAVTPLVGLVDTFVISATGDAAALGGVGLGAVIFSFIVFGFYFLRMGTTGLTAQALGARDEAELQRTLARALIIGAVIGALGALAAPLLIAAGRLAFDASAAAEDAAGQYLFWRFMGAPATLMMLAVQGWLIALGRTRDVLAVNALYALTNAGLDIWFVLELDWGVAGVGGATTLAEWIALAAGAAIVARALKQRGGLAEGVFRRAQLFAADRLMRLVLVNRDLMIRSATLLFGMAWFSNQGARQGDAPLAGNEVLKQLISVSAFVLDAFAFIAEAEVGGAVGEKSPRRLRRAIRLTTELALAAGVLFLILFLAAGPFVIDALVRDEAARQAARAFLPYCALVPLLGMPAWQLDGVFIGATQGAAMRNAGIASVAAYIATDLLLPSSLGNHGVWIAFLSFYLYRAGFLAAFYPSVMRAVRR